MDKLKMQSADGVQDNIQKIAALFPNCVTETVVGYHNDGSAIIKHKVDFEKLQQELSDAVISGREERYQFTWPDKRKAILAANAPVNATLRPCREESVDFDTTQNLYIEGDNLDVLKCLKETYLHKVKMIYIDPPYNTGNDFVYEDDFAESASDYASRSGQFDEQGNRMVTNTESNGRFHTDWLNMIYPRLKVARDLLSDDGVIFISIDDNEVENLRKVCDEIFGESSFVANIVWQSTAGSNTGTDIVTITENVLVYVRNRGIFKFDGSMSSEGDYTLVDEYERERGKYSLDKMDRRRVGSHYSDALNYPITMPDGTLRYPGGFSEKSKEGWNYLWSKTKVEWGVKNGFIQFKQQTDGTWAVYNKRYFKVDNEGKTIERTIPFRNLITSDMFNTAQGTSEIRDLFTDRPFDFPKPSGLIKHLLLTAVRTCADSLILDFFSGSATTAHAVMQLNAEDGGKRKFIIVQLPELTDEKSEAYKAGYKTICEIGKERIRRAGKKIKEELEKRNEELGKRNEELGMFANDDSSSLIPNSTIDTGFRVLKLDSTNMRDIYYSPKDTDQRNLFAMVDNVKPDRTSEDLLFQVMLELGAELSSSIRKEELGMRNDGKPYNIYNVADGYLVACFDQDVTDDVVTAIAKMQPMYAVLCDTSMKTDSTATNFEQIFKTYSPNTVTKVL